MGVLWDADSVGEFRPLKFHIQDGRVVANVDHRDTHLRLRHPGRLPSVLGLHNSVKRLARVILWTRETRLGYVHLG